MDKSAPQVVCVGEALVDFLPDGPGALRHVKAFTPCLGGAPANTAVGLARCGLRSALQTRVGDDEFGRFLATSLADEGVNVDGVTYDPERRTGITFIEIKESGDRSFLFFRNDAAEKAFGPDDLNTAMIAAAQVLHLCTNLMETGPGRAATMRAIEVAREHRRLISVDPNLRVHLWPNEDACRQAGLKLVEHAHLVKLSEDEAELLTGESDPVAAARTIHRMGPGLAVVTLGEQGCVWSGAPGEGELLPPTVNCVDATGAGDAFVAGMLSVLHSAASLPPAAWPASLVQDAMQRGCEVGSAAVTAFGATAAIPRYREIT
jgi:fructokinase